MAGDMQDRYLHGVPAGGSAGTRINLTFRVCALRGQCSQADHQIGDDCRFEQSIMEADQPAFVQERQELNPDAGGAEEGAVTDPEGSPSRWGLGGDGAEE
eukprot:9864735-Alexandrium_andersonii.AAC.1